MKCDICGTEDDFLHPIFSAYQTEEVKNICSTCEKIATTHLNKIRKSTDNIRRSWMQRVLENLRSKRST